MAEPPANVRLSLAATAENVVLVREMLAGVAEGVGLGATHLNDIQTAVTEACNNVVLHAYGSEQGPLDVEVRVGEQTVVVCVQDGGIGMSGRGDAGEEEGDGIGLHVIRTLARAVEFVRPPHGGALVGMEFETPQVNAPERDPDDFDTQTLELAEPASLVTVGIAPIALARTILPRLVSALAARAHFTTDRICDVQILADALVAHVGSALSGDSLDVGVDVEPRALELRVAPLTPGRAQMLVKDSELDGLGAIIEKLTDRRGVNTVGKYETLTLRITDPR
jgi:serine/threonine-protein kinase RsbW